MPISSLIVNQNRWRNRYCAVFVFFYFVFGQIRQNPCRRASNPIPVELSVLAGLHYATYSIRTVMTYAFHPFTVPAISGFVASTTALATFRLTLFLCFSHHASAAMPSATTMPPMM